METLSDLVYNGNVMPSIMLFLVGLIGVLFKKNLLIIFMCIELMLLAGSLLAISFASEYASADGLILAFLVLAIGACEVAIALAVIIQRYKLKEKPFVEDLESERE